MVSTPSAPAAPLPPGPGPLAGLLVLDLSRVLAGPYCSMMLGQLGARIVKIERPGAGDDTRGFGPPFVAGEAAYYLGCNSDKESVAIDLDHPRGRALGQRLAARADVVLENFRPGTAEKLGLGYEALRAHNERLVYCSISGFGHSGLPEYGRRGGYDLIVQGLGGIQSLTGPPEGPPFKVGTSIADLASGLHAVIGILAALEARHRTGRGQHVDVSMLDGQITLLSYQAQIHWATGADPRRMGNAHPNLVPYETYAASDGHFNIGVGTDAMFGALCRAVGRVEWLADTRFSTNAARVENRDALGTLLAPLFAARPVGEWLALCDRLAIPAGRIQSVSQAVAHEQVRARGTVRALPHPTAGTVNVVGLPFLLSDTPAGPRRAAPLLGEHTDAVLNELCGADTGELAALRRDGVIA
jgi:crotonobetainyl-CoA:carnitine CoA-transferase CaiB-like acyl-CoA transferase